MCGLESNRCFILLNVKYEVMNIFFTFIKIFFIKIMNHCDPFVLTTKNLFSRKTSHIMRFKLI